MSIFSPRRKYIPPHPKKSPEHPERLTQRALDDIFSDCEDYNSREVFIGGANGIKAGFCFLDGLVSGADAGDGILRALAELELSRGATEAAVIERLLHGGVFTAEAQEPPDTDAAVRLILNGNCLLVFPLERRALAFEVKSGDKRAVSEPNVENVVKGAKDAFIEDIRTNTALVRRKVRNSQLKTREIMVGRKTNTKTDVLWLEGLSDPELVEALTRRMQNIDVDGAVATSNIEECLADDRRSLFPQLIYTERPGRFAHHLLEGRVGLLIDGLPVGYIVPGTLPQQMKAPEDRANNFIVASVLTLLRYLCLILTVSLPAFYVAVATYHQEMLPVNLLLSIIESKEKLPFSTAAEALVMLIAFEALQEAGLRLPQNIGQTVSIVGALIVGQSAVEAGLISPVIIIIVAMAGIAGYVIPNQDLAAALRVWRFLLTLAAAVMGMYAVGMGLTLLVYRMSRTESFGKPYLAPLVSETPDEALDFGLIRPSIWKTPYRERGLNTRDKRNRG